MLRSTDWHECLTGKPNDFYAFLQYGSPMMASSWCLFPWCLYHRTQQRSCILQALMLKYMLIHRVSAAMSICKRVWKAPTHWKEKLVRTCALVFVCVCAWIWGCLCRRMQPCGQVCVHMCACARAMYVCKFLADCHTQCHGGLFMCRRSTKMRYACSSWPRLPQHRMGMTEQLHNKQCSKPCCCSSASRSRTQSCSRCKTSWRMPWGVYLTGGSRCAEWYIFPSVSLESGFWRCYVPWKFAKDDSFSRGHEAHGWKMCSDRWWAHARTQVWACLCTCSLRWKPCLDEVVHVAILLQANCPPDLCISTSLQAPIKRKALF